MEEWKIISGYENYSVSNTGKIKSLRFNRLLKLSKNGDGYLNVNLIENKIIKTHMIHPLVMNNFGPKKPEGNYVIDHKDTSKDNNNINNLQWLTIGENTEKRFNNYDKKKEIVNLHKQGYSAKEIKDKIDLSMYTIYQTILKYSRTQ